MKTQNDDTPTVRGVYILVHRASGAVFVGASGNLRQRRTVWKSTLRKGGASKKVRGMPDHPVEEWEFKVIRAGADLTDAVVAEVVAATMEKAKRQGLKVVNMRDPAAPAPARPGFDARAHALRLMPVPVLGDDGAPMTYAEIAAATGRSVEGVKEIVKRIRRKASETNTDEASISLEQVRTARTWGKNN